MDTQELLNYVQSTYQSYFGLKGRYGLLNIGLCLGVLGIAYYFNWLPWYSPKNQRQGYLKTFFPRKVYLSQSGLNDIKFLPFVTIPFSTPIYFVIISWLLYSSQSLRNYTNQVGFIVLPEKGVGFILLALIYGFLVFFCRDFFSYFHHRWAHEFRLMWKFHKSHHSAKELTVFTGHRVHLLEDIIDAVTVALGMVLADLLFFMVFKVANADQYFIFKAWGTGLFIFIYLPIMTLKHFHLKISFGKWGDRILVSPAYHHLHHSIEPAHQNCNYAKIFPVFDMIFGTYVDPSKACHVNYRLGVENSEDYQTVFQILVMPFKEIYADLVKK